MSSEIATPCRLLTLEEVRVELNIGRTLAYQLVQSGALPVVRVGHALRVRRADLDAYVDVGDQAKPARDDRVKTGHLR
jgi:excisionase family DNA binding protein